MKRFWRVSILCAALLAPHTSALAWHDTGHMLVAQIAYLRMSPAAKAEVDRLLPQSPERRPFIHLCAGYYTRETCEKLYDPVTIAVWMDDFRGDSLNDSYDTWHYINYKPIFVDTPVRPNVGPLPANVLDRLNWSINTLRTGTGSDKRDAEALGFLYHLAGDVHQPLHAATRYTAAQPTGDNGGNGFRIQPPAGAASVRNLHSFWDSAAGLFGYDSPKRPLDEAARARLRQQAEELMRKYPARGNDWKETNPQVWVEESNHIARTFAYAKTKEGEAPSPEYTEQTRVIVGQRIALAGYRLAAVLDEILVRPPVPRQTP